MSSVNSLPVGLAVPSVRIPGGVLAVRNAIDTAFGDVLLALLTPVGTRPFDRQFGSYLAQLLFASTGDGDTATAQYIIGEAIRRFCPTVNFIEADIALGAEKISIEVVFSLVSDPNTPITRRAFLEKSELLKIVYAPD